MKTKEKQEKRIRQRAQEDENRRPRVQISSFFRALELTNNEKTT